MANALKIRFFIFDHAQHWVDYQTKETILNFTFIDRLADLAM